MALCDVLGVRFFAEAANKNYKRGWGIDSHDALPIICSWTLTLQDINGRTTHISFDLTHGDSPLIIGLDLQQYSARTFIGPQPTIIFQRPSEREERVLPIYIRETDTIHRRAHVDLIGLKPTAATLLVTHRSSVIRANTMAKRLHRYSHAPISEMVYMLQRGGYNTPRLRRLCTDIVEACPVCARSGLPAPCRKISLTHVCQEFNQEVQADFMFANIRGTKYCVLHIVDTGTRYSEATVVSNRSCAIMASEMETVWILRHGAPKRFSADSEFTKGPLKRFLATHNVDLAERPVRRHNKTGIVERKHRTIKLVLERLQYDHSTVSDSVLLARATFLSNVFCGSSILSAFELVRGYTPALLGASSSLVSPTLLDAYKDQQCVRALQRLLRSRQPHTIRAESLPPGTPIYYYYKSSKHP